MPISAKSGPVLLRLPESAPDAELVRRAAVGERWSREVIYRRHVGYLMGFAARLLGNRGDAEEIVQETFLAVWRHPEGYDEERGTVKAWLMGMVHHRAVDLVRREESQRRRAESAQAQDSVLEDADVAESVVEELGVPEERKAVRAALGELPPEQQQVIELMYFGGLTQSAIAERLSLPLGTVKSRTLLGMRRLRTALAGIER